MCNTRLLYINFDDLSIGTKIFFQKVVDKLTNL